METFDLREDDHFTLFRLQPRQRLLESSKALFSTQVAVIIRDYVERHPLPPDVLFLIEVSDTTLGYDRDVKAPLYARSGIPEFWLVNLPEGVIEIYRKPTAGGYENLEKIGPGGAVTPLELPAMTLAVDDILIEAGR